jgi:hypothetical protein
MISMKEILKRQINSLITGKIEEADKIMLVFEKDGKLFKAFEDELIEVERDSAKIFFILKDDPDNPII